jgi:adenine deaminase
LVVTYIPSKITRKELVNVALGRSKSDTVIEHVNLVNVNTREVYIADIAIKGERIALVGDARHTKGDRTRTIDGAGLYAIPGLIDGHIHVESTMMAVEEFSRILVARGTTCVNADLNETANVLGARGFKLFHMRARQAPLRIFLTAPSSIPLSKNQVEVPASKFDVSDVEEALKMEGVYGLSEILSTADLLAGSSKLLTEVQLALNHGKYIDGNAPSLMGGELNAYIDGGPQHDHESVTPEEALERLRLGMWVMLREGSSERNLPDIAVILKDGKIDARRCCFATDDKDAWDLAHEGHIDHCLRRSVELGIPALTAIQMATINCAEYLGVQRDIGSISPGKMADIVIVEDLEQFAVNRVLVGGSVVAEEGKPTYKMEKLSYPSWALNTVKPSRAVKTADLRISAPEDGTTRIRVLDVSKGTIVSDMTTADLIAHDLVLKSDTEQDLLKVVVVERYGKTNLSIGKGFTRGFGLKCGALASSIAHCAHNIISVGTNDEDMAGAIARVVKIRGGLVAFRNGKSVAEMQLRLAGIMSTEPWEIVSEKLEDMNRTVRDELGCKLRSPFMVLSFETTASVPELKISTKGLIHASTMKNIPLIL